MGQWSGQDRLPMLPVKSRALIYSKFVTVWLKLAIMGGAQRQLCRGLVDWPRPAAASTLLLTNITESERQSIFSISGPIGTDNGERPFTQAPGVPIDQYPRLHV